MVDTGRYVVPRYGRFLIVLGPLLPPEATTQLLQIATAYGHNLPILHDSIRYFLFFNFLLDRRWQLFAPKMSFKMWCQVVCCSHHPRLLFVPAVSCLSGWSSKPWFLQTEPKEQNKKWTTDTFLPRFFLQESRENGKSNQVILIYP